MPKKTFEAAEKAGAHLIVQLKDNQPTLLEKVRSHCEKAMADSVHESIDKNRRNRHETRRVGVFSAAAVVAGTEWERHVRCIIMVERTVLKRRTSDGLFDKSFEAAFYLSNRPIKAKRADTAVRGHWRIETSNHYVRDVTMGEDASRIRKNPGIFARLRSIALNILRKNQVGTIAQTRWKAAFGGVNFVLSMRCM